VKNATSLKYRLERNFVLNMIRLEGKREFGGKWMELNVNVSNCS
jgi:hypothetical protein